MNRIKFIFRQLNWLDLLLISIISLSIVSFDLLTFHYTPNIELDSVYHYYGFPIPYEKCLPWANNLHKTIFIGPFLIDLVFHFFAIVIIYWFILRYAFTIDLKMNLFIPLTFGMLFTILIPYILPGQGYELWLNNFDLNNFTVNFNWYGHDKLY